jgi:hypothetical protein
VVEIISEGTPQLYTSIGSLLPSKWGLKEEKEAYNLCRETYRL